MTNCMFNICIQNQIEIRSKNVYKFVYINFMCIKVRAIAALYPENYYMHIELSNYYQR